MGIQFNFTILKLTRKIIHQGNRVGTKNTIFFLLESSKFYVSVFLERILIPDKLTVIPLFLDTLQRLLRTRINHFILRLSYSSWLSIYVFWVSLNIEESRSFVIIMNTIIHTLKVENFKTWCVLKTCWTH